MGEKINLSPRENGSILFLINVLVQPVLVYISRPEYSKIKEIISLIVGQ